MSLEDDGVALVPTSATQRDRHEVARILVSRTGFVLLVGLAATGAWSIYSWLNDPIRLAGIAMDNGSAEKALAVHLAKQRVCARVLDGRDPFTTYSTSSTTLPSVRALKAAGLIEEVPAAELPRDRPYLSYRKTRAAAPFVMVDRMGDDRFISLCYGRPKLGWGYLETDGSTNPSPVMRFNYTIDQRPTWADRPDMRAAFPFLDELTKEPVRHYLGVRFNHGTKPDLNNLWIEPSMDVDAAVSGFGFCPPPGYSRVEACKSRDDD